MGFFGSTPKRVTDKEFKKAMGELAAKGVSKADRAKIELVTHGHQAEKGRKAGVDKEELEEAMKLLKEKKNRYGLTDKTIDTADNALKKKL